MRLVQISDKIRPLTLAVGLMSASSTFAYSDVDSYSRILTVTTNNNTSEYMKLADNSDLGLFINKFRFQTFLSNWQKKTLFMSSPSSIIENDDFKSIIAMGHYVVPFIIEEIELNPSTLVWSLNIIFNRKITKNPNATISDACKLWVKELKK